MEIAAVDDIAQQPCYIPAMVAFRKHPSACIASHRVPVWDIADPSRLPCQLIDNEPVAMAPDSETYVALQAEVSRLVGKGSPCRLLDQPSAVPRICTKPNFCISNPILPTEILPVYSTYREAEVFRCTPD